MSSRRVSHCSDSAEALRMRRFREWSRAAAAAATAAASRGSLGHVLRLSLALLLLVIPKVLFPVQLFVWGQCNYREECQSLLTRISYLLLNLPLPLLLPPLHHSLIVVLLF